MPDEIPPRQSVSKTPHKQTAHEPEPEINADTEAIATVLRLVDGNRATQRRYVTMAEAVVAHLVGDE